MKKSALALILAVLMAVGLLTIGAAADDPVGSKDNPFTTVDQYNNAIKTGDLNGKDVYLTVENEEFDNSSNPFNLTNVQSRETPPQLHLTITGCTFTGNTAKDSKNPSFMYLSNCKELVIDDCEFDSGTGLVYGINWNLIQITDATVKITNCIFNGEYSENAIKLNQRNGADDTATDIKYNTWDNPPIAASIASAEIDNVTINSTVPVILLGSAGKGSSGAAAPSTGAFPITISNCEGSGGKDVNVFLAYNASETDADKIEEAMKAIAAGNPASEEALALAAKLVVPVNETTPVSKTANGDLAENGDFVARIGNDKFTSLESAITAAANNSTIVMEKNYTFTAPITFDTNKKITLDLNGKDLKYEGNDNYAMTLCGGADLTIDDTAAGSGDDGMFWSAARVIAVGDGANGKTNSTGATLTVNDGVISSGKYEEDGDETYHCAIAIRANYQVGGDSVPCKVTINSVINGGIYVFGNGAELNIEDDAVILTKSSYAISGNGTKNATNDQGNTVINIKGGLIEQNDETGAAIYHPQSGTLNISGDPIITGATGIQLCSGTANISGGTITGEGADSREDKNSDGLISDGAAVSVVDRSYPGGAPKMNISGGAFVSKQSEAVLAYTWNGNEASAWEDASDNVAVSGGSFSSSVAEYVTDDFKFELNNKGTYSYYNTAEKALANAEPGAVIKGIGDQAAVNVYSLKVVYGNGQADYPVKVPDGTKYTLPAVSKPGYIFMGWKCSDGHTYEANVTVTITGNVTFTAIWANMPDITPGTPDDDDEPVVPDFPFTDVREGQWFYEAVKYVYDEGIMNGMDRNTFDPNGSLTRAMVWTMLARLEGVDTENGANWYAKAQEWAVEAGVSDGTDPMGNITREQLVTMLWRLNGSETVTGSLTGYTDYDKVSDWAGNAMLWATVNGIIEGDEANALNPTAGCTRAQAAAMIMRFCEYHEGTSFGTVV